LLTRDLLLRVFFSLAFFLSFFFFFLSPQLDVVLDGGAAMAGLLTKHSGLESGNGEINVVTGSVERNLPLQGRRSLLQVDDVSARQRHAELRCLVRRRALDLFFLAHGDELLKDFGEESHLLLSRQFLQHRLQEQLLVVRRIHQDGLVEDVAVVVLARHGGFLDVTHDGALVRRGDLKLTSKKREESQLCW